MPELITAINKLMGKQEFDSFFEAFDATDEIDNAIENSYLEKKNGTNFSLIIKIKKKISYFVNLIYLISFLLSGLIRFNFFFSAPFFAINPISYGRSPKNVDTRVTRRRKKKEVSTNIVRNMMSSNNQFSRSSSMIVSGRRRYCFIVSFSFFSYIFLFL